MKWRRIEKGEKFSDIFFYLSLLEGDRWVYKREVYPTSRKLRQKVYQNRKCENQQTVQNKWSCPHLNQDRNVSYMLPLLLCSETKYLYFLLLTSESVCLLFDLRTSIKRNTTGLEKLLRSKNKSRGPFLGTLALKAPLLVGRRSQHRNEIDTESPLDH